MAQAKRPRTAPAAVRRRQLIDAAIASIAQHGISGVTMADVTGRAGMSVGTVSYHFDSKENLLVETLIHLAEEHRELWFESVGSPTHSPTEKLTALVDANFHPLICTRQKLAVWFAFFGERKYRAAYRDRFAAIDRERFEVTERLVGQIAREGGYERIDPAATTQSIECMVDGLWLGLMTYPDWLTRDMGRARIHQLLAITFPRHFSPSPDTAGT